METQTDPEPTVFEKALLDALLAGDHPFLAALRGQYARATPTCRELSGAGLFLNFQVPPDEPDVAPRNFEIGDVYFDLDGLPHGGGALLFVRDGFISFLEAFSHDGDWPERTDTFAIHYVGPSRDFQRLDRELESRAGPIQHSDP